jgi:hypothetical protein
MIVCFECGKEIKGKMVCTNPPILSLRLGIDFPKSFHPKCYDRAEEKARKELEV